MTQISAEVIADSLSPQGCRLTTMRVIFPRYILAEFNTHRMFSRNSASSRAIPFEKMVQAVESDPFVPIAWQKDHRGMQGTEYWNPELTPGRDFPMDWLRARDAAVERAQRLYASGHGVTKQLCNRLLEPFMWHTVLISATEWENFFSLRCPRYEHTQRVTDDNSGEVQYSRSKKDYINVETGGHYRPEMEADYDWLSINRGQAEIHMMALAEAMWDARNESKPTQLKAGEWHIPFGEDLHFGGADTFPALFGQGTEQEKQLIKMKVATARCARVSYTVAGTEGKEYSYEDDIKLHDRLVQSGHWSALEHCAQAMSDEEFYAHIRTGSAPTDVYGRPGEPEPYVEWFAKDSLQDFGWCANFRGFTQYRKMFSGENRV